MFDWRKLKEEQITKLVMRHFGRVKTLREVHEPLMRINTKLFLPRRSEISKSRKKGDEYTIPIYDANPAMAARKFSVGWTGQMVEKSYGDQWWLNFEVADQDLMKVDRVKEYLQNYAVQIRHGYDNSDFYREFPLFLKNGSVTHGTMTARSDLQKDRVVFTNRDPWDHWFSVDQDGDIDCDFFRLDMTAKTICEKKEFKNNVPDKILKQMDPENKEGDPFAEYEVICAVYENGSVRNDSVNPTDKPYISFYIIAAIETGKDYTLLGREGVEHRPITLRLGERTASGIPISMAADALTSAIFGNALSKHRLKASHLGVEPPALVSATLEDQVLLNKLNPNSKTFVKDAEERIEYITTKLNPQDAEYQILKEDRVVNDIFYITLLEMLTGRESSVKTASEIYAMIDEQLGLTGPVVEATEDDALEPCTEIIALHEEHRLPKMPQELLDYINERGQVDSRGEKYTKLKNKYVGKLHRLKRMLPQAKSSVEQIAIMKEFGEVFPDSLVIIEQRKTLERILVARGMPMDEIKTDAMLKQIDAEIQRRQEFEEKMLMAERVAKMTPPLTKDAVDPKSPAAQIAGSVK